MAILRLPMQFLALTAWAAPLLAQTFDLAAARRELDALFERPAGQIIGPEQQQRLSEFLKRHEGQDLGPLGYAKALEHYFRREPAAGAAALDTFFAAHPRIENPEHALMAGRIYLVALREGSQAARPDWAALRRHAERAVALYPDLPVVGRVVAPMLAQADDSLAFRMALVRGAMGSAADDAAKDRFLQSLYSPAEANPGARDTVPPVPLRGVGFAPQANGTTPQPLVAGAALPELKLEHRLLAKDDFMLADWRGEVVVLDFFATWCPPCRTGMPLLHKLLEPYGTKVRCAGVTRFYGRGMDFAAGAVLPHGGSAVHDLDRTTEIAVNERFAKAFGIEHPILFTDEATMQQKFGVMSIPTLFVVGKDGRIVGSVLGSGERQLQQLRELLEQALR
ncbi:MAG: redoxin family protein [Planctomycetes bacterium]|nr:redoxin family protein [Planctomycetota bacterium]